MTNDNKPQPGDIVYRSFRSDRLDRAGVYVSHFYGTVSPCGEWVDSGESRYRLSPTWHLRSVDAEASEAEQLERYAAALVAQARRLRVAAGQEVAS